MRRRAPRPNDPLLGRWRRLAPAPRALWAVAIGLAVLYAAEGVAKLVA